MADTSDAASLVRRHQMAADPRALALAMAAKISASIKDRAAGGSSAITSGTPGSKLREKIIIPIHDYPDINFLGFVAFGITP
eukprot:1344027-Amorphochlora_amoeboformis.AAC.1